MTPLEAIKEFIEQKWTSNWSADKRACFYMVYRCDYEDMLMRLELYKQRGIITITEDTIIFKGDDVLGDIHITPGNHFYLYYTDDPSPESIGKLHEGLADGIHYADECVHVAGPLTNDVTDNLPVSTTQATVRKKWVPNLTIEGSLRL